MANKVSQEEEVPVFRLFVKAPQIKGVQGSRFAADIFAHRLMFIMAKKDIVNAKVVPVEPIYKKETLENYGISDTSVKLPCIHHITNRDEIPAAEDDPSNIEHYLESKFGPELRPNDANSAKAFKVTQDIFHKFTIFMKTDKGSNAEQTKLKGNPFKALNDELRRIDSFLMQKQTLFLCGDSITLPDCNLLPKLHYIRVAGKYFKQFEIPEEFTALKSYMEAGYLDEAFQESKCTDDEIIECYKRR